MPPCISPPTPPKACSKDEALELLEKFHNFPCEYMFKVIGYAGEGFVKEVRLAAEAVLGPLSGQGQIRSRQSSQKRYVSVTIEAEVKDARQVLEVYKAIRTVPGIVTLA